KERLASEEAVRRFDQEVRAAAQLHHPNIVMAFDAGHFADTHYFAMEYVEGVDLARQVREKGPLSAVQVSEYGRQAALGLQHAHQKGMVHRDIKPSNLMLSIGPDGKPVVKVLDMGLARFRGKGDTALTQTDQIIGTPDF